MPNKAEEEREALVRAGETREAGVGDLMAFYARVEELYATASRALVDEQTSAATNATNTPSAR
jgi:hypothetical protein